jgi:TatA/E family protein of Tat protein translocase
MSITSNITLQPYRKNKSLKVAAFRNRLTRKFAGVIMINNTL